MIVTILRKRGKDLHVVNSWSIQNMSKNEKKILVKKGFFTCTYKGRFYSEGAGKNFQFFRAKNFP